MKVTQGNITRVLKSAGWPRSAMVQVVQGRRGSQRGTWHYTEGFVVEDVGLRHRVFIVTYRPGWPEIALPPEVAQEKADFMALSLRGHGLNAEVLLKDERYEVKVVVEE